MADEPRQKWPTVESPKGLTCPECGCGHLPVLNTRHAFGRVVRYRRCRFCGRRIVTYEVRPADVRDTNE